MVAHDDELIRSLPQHYAEKTMNLYIKLARIQTFKIVQAGFFMSEKDKFDYK